MSISALVIGGDEAETRALLSVLPVPAEADLVQLGDVDRDAAHALPVRSAVVFAGLDPSAVAVGDLAEMIDPYLSHSGLVLLGSSQWSRDLAGTLAHRRGAALVWAVDRIRADDDVVVAEHIVLGGSHRLLHRIDPRGLTVLLVKPAGSVSGRASVDPVVRDGAIDTPGSGVRVINRTVRKLHGRRLSEASVVVCIGRGVGAAEHVPLFRALADRLDAALGATRAVVERGWLPFINQVGQTGEMVAPELYLGFGISGAPQHLAGIRASKCIAAINTDPDAPLCRIADLVVTGDAVDVAGRLLDVMSRSNLSPQRRESKVTHV